MQALRVKVLASKLGDLILVPRTHVGWAERSGGDSRLLAVILASTVCVCVCVCVCVSHRHTHTEGGEGQREGGRERG